MTDIAMVDYKCSSYTDRSYDDLSLLISQIVDWSYFAAKAKMR